MKTTKQKSLKMIIGVDRRIVTLPVGVGPSPLPPYVVPAPIVTSSQEDGTIEQEKTVNTPSQS